MGEDTTSGTKNGSAPRTVAQLQREIDQTRIRLTLLELEMKKLRNPNGPTFAGLKGIWAGADISAEEIERAKFRVPAKLEAVVGGDGE